MWVNQPVRTSENIQELMLSAKQKEIWEKFCESLILSDNAKKFVLARELLKIKEKEFVFKGTTAAGFLFSTYLITKAFNNALNMFRRTPLARGLSYASIFSSMLCSYWVFVDLKSRGSQGWLDESVASLGADYAEGGVEYYTKILERNKALREIKNDKAGHKKYNRHGEFVTSIFRDPYLPFKDRASICEKALCKK